MSVLNDLLSLKQINIKKHKPPIFKPFNQFTCFSTIKERERERGGQGVGGNREKKMGRVFRKKTLLPKVKDELLVINQ